MKDKLLTSFLFAAVLVALASTAMASTTWYVNGVSGTDSNNCMSTTAACKTIGHAMSLSASGDTIRVAAATYTENLTISISLTIVGSGAGTTIIDGGGVKRVLIISSGANVSLSKFTVRHGYALSGGGIANSGALTINRSVVTANTAHRDCVSYTCANDGGGIQNSGALTLNNSSVIGNTVSLAAVPNFSSCKSRCDTLGGGIWNTGTLVINSSTVSGNTSFVSCIFGNCSSEGGGIFNGGSGTTTISRSAISGNKARYGGGVDNYGTLTLTNSTLSGNVASFSAGGGISNINGGTLLINNSTISTNNVGISGSGGGGIDVHDGPVTLQNSIVANNGSGGNCHGSMTSNGYNLSSDGTCNFNGPGDLNSIDPMLGPLRFNGGPTKTMALPSGSLAIDAGNPAGCTDGAGHLLTTDQRGKPRPDPEDTGGCDIGAYESQTD